MSPCCWQRAPARSYRIWRKIFAEHEEAGGFEKVRKAMYGGLRKVLARMGISTVASYRNSHLFEVLGPR